MSDTFGFSTRNIGPCEVEYDGVVIGLTEGGVTLNTKYDTHETTADITGTTARRKIVTGVKVNVEANLTEVTVTQLAKIIPGSTLTEDIFIIQNCVGTDLVTNAKVLILKPLVGSGNEGIDSDGAVSDDTEWVTVPLASVTPDLAVPFALDKQRIYKVTFEGHPTTVGSYKNALWYIGASA